MTVENYRSLVVAEQEGQSFFSAWRKAPTQTTVANIWFDLSMSPGAPVPNYYIGVPNVFTRLRQSTDGGIPHGGNVAQLGAQKFLRLFEAQTATAAATPLPLFLLDYQGFYPFIDESVTDEQFLDNSGIVLRYSRGVQIMPVVVAGHIGGGTWFVRYTNDRGVTGRQTPQHVLTAAQLVNGTILSSGGAVANSRGPFMPLQAGDNGILSIQSINLSATMTSGVLALVYCKPVGLPLPMTTIGVPAERDYINQLPSMPIIPDGACLNWLMYAGAATPINTPYFGSIQTVWK